MQLDIFEHSRDTMLRNDVAEALLRRDAAAAATALQSLRDEFAADECLAPLGTLLAALDAPAAPGFDDHRAAQSARGALVDRVEPAARRIFGAPGGAAWLLPLRRDLARRAAPLGFDPEHADAHAAALWLRAGDAVAAAAACERIDSWRRIPAPLAFMTEARYLLHDLDGIWPLLTELAWLAPRRLDALTKRLADPVLTRLRRDFDAGFEGAGNAEDLAWFPAWVLTRQPALARLIGQAEAGRHAEPEQALRLLVEILGLERQGRQADLVARRRRLRDLNGTLYAAYTATR